MGRLRTKLSTLPIDDLSLGTAHSTPPAEQLTGKQWQIAVAAGTVQVRGRTKCTATAVQGSSVLHRRRRENCLATQLATQTCSLPATKRKTPRGGETLRE